MRSIWLFLMLILPLAFSWVYPHQRAYSADWGEEITLCATIYPEQNGPVFLYCAGELVGEQNVVRGLPAVVCFNYRPTSSAFCRWVEGVNEVFVRVDVFPHALVDAVLAVILVVLVVRFTVKLVKTLL